VSTTVFITRWFKKIALEPIRQLFFAWVIAWLCVAGTAWAVPTDVTDLRVERTDDGIALSATVRFDVPPVMEDALLKGIPLVFVVEADIYRDRWYWTDPRVASAARTIRLAYQPLTRRWRVNSAPGVIGSATGLRSTFNQNYDSLVDAMSAIQRLARWRIAEASDIALDATHRLEFSFRLDLSQLPRPFQIGVAGQSDWSVGAQVKERLKIEAAAQPVSRAGDPAK
jgi:Domain of unknown function (DUF4390)